MGDYSDGFKAGVKAAQDFLRRRAAQQEKLGSLGFAGLPEGYADELEKLVTDPTVKPSAK